MYMLHLIVQSAYHQVWTHYDVMDNIYCQVVGHKQAVLWPPWESLVNSQRVVVDLTRTTNNLVAESLP